MFFFIRTSLKLMAGEINRVDVNTSRQMMSIPSRSKSLLKKRKRTFIISKTKVSVTFRKLSLPYDIRNLTLLKTSRKRVVIVSWC